MILLRQVDKKILSEEELKDLEKRLPDDIVVIGQDNDNDYDRMVFAMQYLKGLKDILKD